MATLEQSKAGKVVVALDAHGGDFGPSVTVPAALEVLAIQHNLEILLCGIPAQVQPVLDRHCAGGRFGHCIERMELKEASHALARFEPSKHNGAPLLGLEGVVVKSHGNAGRGAMANAIREAVKESERNVPQRIAAMIHDYSIEEHV